MHSAVCVHQVAAAAKQAFRRAVSEASPRLVEAMFLCEVYAASEALSGATSEVSRPGSGNRSIRRRTLLCPEHATSSMSPALPLCRSVDHESDESSAAARAPGTDSDCHCSQTGWVG